VPALTSAPEGATARGGRPAPGSLGAVGQGWLVALFLVCAGYAAAVALLASSGVQHQWAVLAAPGYALATLAAAWPRRGRDLALLLGLGGGLVAPLAWLVAENRTLQEARVISHAAWLLIHHGSPYLSVATLAGTQNPEAYNPYLPAMTVFGLGRAAIGGPLTDPRIWFTVVFIAFFWLALRTVGTPDSGRWTALVTATPVIGFPLAVGGDDVPVLGLMCLGLALLSRSGREPRPVLAGLVLGVAAAMKATAWPAVLIAAVLVAGRDGRRATARFAAAVLTALAVLIGPVAAASPGALWDNTILFPLGLASVKSAATSPLPGVLLSQTGHAGHLLATALLALAGLGVVLSLVVWPLRDVRGATWRLIIGLAVMFALAPSTRFGYYLYPVGLWIWLRVSRLRAEPRRAGPPAGAVAGRADSRDQARRGFGRIRLDR
jgi:Glycosyltransferase family 87